MVFNIQLNLLLNLNNGNLALTTILINDLNSYDENRINEIVSDFKSKFETKNSVVIEKISFLTNKQAELFKEQFETNISSFQKEKHLLILKEANYYLEEYLNELCNQHCQLKLEEKDKSIIISSSLLISNVYFQINKLKEIHEYFSNDLTNENKENIKKYLNNISLFLSNIHCNDYIIAGLKRIILDLDKK